MDWRTQLTLPWVGPAWRASLRLWFWAFQRHRHGRAVIEKVEGMPIVVLPEVMNPVLFRTGEYLAEVLDADLGSSCPGSVGAVLDMGTGSGVGAIFAARCARRVVAVDINPEAVRCARINVLLHHLEDRVEVREGDLFGPVQGKRFDLVLFNPPFFPGQPQSHFERALWSTDVVERFAAGLADHLEEEGSALVLLSSLADQDRHLGSFRDHGLTVEPIAHRRMVGEELTVYRLRKEHTRP